MWLGAEDPAIYIAEDPAHGGSGAGPPGTAVGNAHNPQGAACTHSPCVPDPAARCLPRPQTAPFLAPVARCLRSWRSRGRGAALRRSLRAPACRNLAGAPAASECAAIGLDGGRGPRTLFPLCKRAIVRRARWTGTSLPGALSMHCQPLCRHSPSLPRAAVSWQGSTDLAA